MVAGEKKNLELIVLLEKKVELTAGYETKTLINSSRKERNYKALLDRLPYLYNTV